MRFKNKYKDGETRFVKKFLWFPKNIFGETRWLENATYIEIFAICSGGYKYWTPQRWVD